MDIAPFLYTIKDKNVLLAAYMPYIKPGGLFLRGIDLQMHHPVGIILEIPGETTKYGLHGRVIWVTPLGINQGVGIQFGESLAFQQLKIRMDQLLIGLERTKNQTYTL